jgi:excisionase family DNA binding protein
MVDFLTTRQLQEILHVDRTTIYRMADDGRIPAVKVGSQWRFPRRSIEGWLKAQSGVAVASDAAPNGAGLPSGDTGLDKQLPVECVQKILDTFASVLGVMMVVTDLEGQPLTHFSNPCGLFALAEASPQAHQRCLRDWAAQAKRPGLQPEMVQGHLGLSYTRGLVRVGTEIKAMLIAGGMAPAQWPPEEREIARLAEYLDVPEAALRRHIDEVFHLDAGEQQRVLAYVQQVADILAHIIRERNLLFAKLQHIAELSKI